MRKCLNCGGKIRLQGRGPRWYECQSCGEGIDPGTVPGSLVPSLRSQTDPEWECDQGINKDANPSAR